MVSTCRFIAVWRNHGPYSGGDRGRDKEFQLNLGIRGLELDFHDDDYGDRPDWQVGHFDPGEDVLFGNGNPIGDGLNQLAGEDQDLVSEQSWSWPDYASLRFKRS